MTRPRQGPGGQAGNHTLTPTIVLTGVVKFEVAPNNTLYTLQYTSGPTPWAPFYSGNLDAFVGSSLNRVQYGINNFGVDSYSNIVSVDAAGRVYSDYVFQRYDKYEGLYLGYDQWQLLQDSAGNVGY